MKEEVGYLISVGEKPHAVVLLEEEVMVDTFYMCCQHPCSPR